MEINSRSVASGDVTILELIGRFDAYEVDGVKDWLKQAATTKPSQVVVNMTGVNFVDSSGLAALVQGMKHCRQQEGDLYLYGLQQPVRIIFELTRLDKAFEIFAEESEAINAFGS